MADASEIGRAAPSCAEPAELEGRVVVVTRPTDRAVDLGAALIARGATVLQMPLTEIADLHVDLLAALGDMCAYDWLLVTSVTTVGFLGPVLSFMSRTRIAAIGEATAEALRGLGLEPDLVSDRPLGEALGAALLAFESGPRRAAFPVAQGAGEALNAVLTEAGWSIAKVEVYASVPVSISASIGRTLVGADAVVLAAPSAARVWAQVLADQAETAGSAAGAAPALVAIGRTTAAEIAALGLGPCTVAPSPTTQGLVDGVILAVTEPAASVG